MDNYNKFFPPRIKPNWLKIITDLFRYEPNIYIREKIKNDIKTKMRDTDLSEILFDSLYYSGCGNDITPILFFEKHIHSFIYCLDITYNLPYESEFESVKNELKKLGYKKKININLDLNFLLMKNWIENDDWFLKNIHRHKANWSIWYHDNDFFSLIFFSCHPEILWKNFYSKRHIKPKIFYFQGFCDSWKGGLGKDEGGEFIVNSEFYSDGINVYRNKE